VGCNVSSIIRLVSARDLRHFMTLAQCTVSRYHGDENSQTVAAKLSKLKSVTRHAMCSVPCRFVFCKINYCIHYTMSKDVNKDLFCRHVAFCEDDMVRAVLTRLQI